MRSNKKQKKRKRNRNLLKGTKWSKADRRDSSYSSGLSRMRDQNIANCRFARLSDSRHPLLSKKTLTRAIVANRTPNRARKTRSNVIFNR